MIPCNINTLSNFSHHPGNLKNETQLECLGNIHDTIHIQCMIKNSAIYGAFLGYLSRGINIIQVQLFSPKFIQATNVIQSSISFQKNVLKLFGNNGMHKWLNNSIHWFCIAIFVKWISSCKTIRIILLRFSIINHSVFGVSPILGNLLIFQLSTIINHI